MKDLFSNVSALYASSRPGYPVEMIEYILSYIPEKDLAWDVATGNGQIAGLLAPHFKEIVATDISLQQIDNAIKKDNIQYKIERAEKSSLKDKSVDLITIGQAIHWFDFEAFNKEVYRVLKPGGIIAAIGYQLIEINKEVDEAIQKLYAGVLGNYWDPERIHFDDNYMSISFPYEELPFPAFSSKYNWTFQQLINNLNTWSAVTRYKEKHGVDPVKELEPALAFAWGNPEEKKEINFPIFGRFGRKRG